MRLQAISVSIAVSMILTFAMSANAQDDHSKDAERLSAAMRQYSQYVKSKTRKVPRNPIPPLYLWLAKKGDIGRLSGNSTEGGNSFRVLQVLDDENMLITTSRGQLSDTFVTESGENLISKEVTVWVSGVPTEGIVDDSFVRLSQLFEVKGTKKYDSNAGGSAVLEIAPFSIQDQETLKKALKALPAKK